MSIYRLALILLCLLASPLRAEPLVYVVQSKPAALVTFRLQGNPARLVRSHRLAIPERPMTIASSPHYPILYLGLRDENGRGRLLSVSAEAEPRQLAEAKLPFQTRFLHPESSGKFVLFADYFGGKVGVLRTEEGIVTSELVSQLETEKFAHGILLSRDERYAFAPHTGPNKIYQLHFDSQTGRLSPNGTAEGPQESQDNRAPRHLTLHPSLDLFLSSNEHKGGVSSWKLKPDGQLQLLESLSTLPEDFEGSSTAADIHVTPDGNFVYGSNRGGKGATSAVAVDSLAGFRLDPKERSLKKIGHFPMPQRPRSFSISPDGQYLICAGQSDKTLSLYRINSDSGQLEAMASHVLEGTPNWVLIEPSSR